MNKNIKWVNFYTLINYTGELMKTIKLNIIIINKPSKLINVNK